MNAATTRNQFNQTAPARTNTPSPPQATGRLFGSLSSALGAGLQNSLQQTPFAAAPAGGNILQALQQAAQSVPNWVGENYSPFGTISRPDRWQSLYQQAADNAAYRLQAPPTPEEQYFASALPQNLSPENRQLQQHLASFRPEFSGATQQWTGRRSGLGTAAPRQWMTPQGTPIRMAQGGVFGGSQMPQRFEEAYAAQNGRQPLDWQRAADIITRMTMSPGSTMRALPPGEGVRGVDHVAVDTSRRNNARALLDATDEERQIGMLAGQMGMELGNQFATTPGARRAATAIRRERIREQRRAGVTQQAMLKRALRNRRMANRGRGPSLANQLLRRAVLFGDPNAQRLLLGMRGQNIGASEAAMDRQHALDMQRMTENSPMYQAQANELRTRSDMNAWATSFQGLMSQIIRDNPSIAQNPATLQQFMSTLQSLFPPPQGQGGQQATTATAAPTASGATASLLPETTSLSQADSVLQSLFSEGSPTAGTYNTLGLRPDSTAGDIIRALDARQGDLSTQDMRAVSDLAKALSGKMGRDWQKEDVPRNRLGRNKTILQGLLTAPKQGNLADFMNDLHTARQRRVRRLRELVASGHPMPMN